MNSVRKGVLCALAIAASLVLLSSALLFWRVWSWDAACRSARTELGEAGEQLSLAEMVADPEGNESGRRWISEGDALVSLLKEFPIPLPSIPRALSGGILTDLSAESYHADGESVLWSGFEAEADPLSKAVQRATLVLRDQPIFPWDVKNGDLAQFPWLTGGMSYARAQVALGLLDLRRGRVAEAADRVVALLDLARAVEGRPLLISLVVSVALQQQAYGLTWAIAGRAEANDVVLTSLLRAWEAAPGGSGLGSALRFERAFALSYFDLPSSEFSIALRKAGGGGGDTHRTDLLVTAWHVVFGMQDAHHLMLLYQRLIDAAPDPGERWVDALASAEAQEQSLAPGRLENLFSRLVLPAMPAAFKRAAEAEARKSLAITALGIARYRVMHSGKTPASLDELSPAFLAAVPRDPRTGEAWEYEADGAEFLLQAAVSEQPGGPSGDVASDAAGRTGAPSPLWPRAGNASDLSVRGSE
jgi:hypothetical protein